MPNKPKHGSVVRYKIITKLGHGAFGAVYLAMNQKKKRRQPNLAPPQKAE